MRDIQEKKRRSSAFGPVATVCAKSLYTGKEYIKWKKKTRLYPFLHGPVYTIYLVHIWREILGWLLPLCSTTSIRRTRVLYLYIIPYIIINAYSVYTYRHHHYQYTMYVYRKTFFYSKRFNHKLYTTYIYIYYVGIQNRVYRVL